MGGTLIQEKLLQVYKDGPSETPGNNGYIVWSGISLWLGWWLPWLSPESFIQWLLEAGS